MTKDEALQKIAELKAYVEGLEKGAWQPVKGEDYFYADSYGDVEESWWNDDRNDKFRLSVGNVYKTLKQAEQYKRRLQAMKPKYLPKMNEKYWGISIRGDAISCKWENDIADRFNYYAGTTFKTKQEAQAWWKEYKDVFEIGE